MSHISAFVASRNAVGNSPYHRELTFAPQHGGEFAGIILLRAPIDKLSILLVGDFNGTSLVEVVDSFFGLATTASPVCSSFQ
jgi:hypothetical protein